MGDIKTDAEIIAKLILNTDSQYRGDLFAAISKELRKETQYYTGNLFRKISIEYGINDGPN